MALVLERKIKFDEITLKMKHLIVILLFLTPGLMSGQTYEPDINYYKFHNDTQMIEFDYLSAYHRKVNHLEQSQPRALSWEMVLGPPLPNKYIFRNKRGEIVRHYGEYKNLTFLSVKESIKKAQAHKSHSSNSGSFLGYSQITTRYFPYYLIGSQSNQLTGKLGLIDSMGYERLRPEFNSIWKYDHIFITRKDSLFEIRDINLVIKFVSTEFELKPSQFHRGYIEISKNQKFGLMDSLGNIIVECDYDLPIGSFNEFGLTNVVMNNKHGLLNNKGEIIVDCKYQYIDELKEGLFNVRYNDKWGYIDTNGNTIIPHLYDIGISFNEGRARVARRISDTWYFGFIDLRGNEVIPLIYSNAKDFENGVAEVLKDGKWIKIDKAGTRMK